MSKMYRLTVSHRHYTFPPVSRTAVALLQQVRQCVPGPAGDHLGLQVTVEGLCRDALAYHVHQRARYPRNAAPVSAWNNERTLC